jgi:hypothetical protein
MKGWSSFVVGGACAAAFAAGLWRAPAAFRRLDANAAAYTHQTSFERSLHAAYGEGIDVRFLVDARQMIPRRGSYAVITGTSPGNTSSSPSALVAITPYSAYWLLPRRQLAADGSVAPQWVLSYGGDLRALHYRYTRVVRVGKGLAIAQVAR